MVEVNLGAIRFNWRGAYAGGTAYVADDVVSSGGSSYICILASTGNAVSNATYWSQMSAAGTDGTDLTSTLTTQGDVLYRDGSGLQRLAKGTAAQVLSVNSGATAPEWADAAAGGAWTLISSVEINDAITTTITGLTSATYEQWAVGFSDVKTESGGADQIRFQIGDSGGLETGTGYNFSTMIPSADSTTYYGIKEMNGTVGFQVCGLAGEGINGFGGMYYIHNPSTSDTKPMITGTGVNVKDSDGGRATQAVLAGTFTSNITLDRIALVGVGSSDKIYSGRITVWGIKHA